MWLLPNDPEELGASLPEGVHLLPSHYTDTDRRTLLALLRLAVPKGTRVYAMSLRMADEAMRLGMRFPDTLLVVADDDGGLIDRESIAALEALDARYLLVQPFRGTERTAWLEGVLKVPLMHWLRRELRRPDHPMRALGVAKLNVLEAAAKTADPVQLVTMVASAIDHRLRFARVGVKHADWERSVEAGMMAAGLGVSTPNVARLRGDFGKWPHRRLLHIPFEIALGWVSTEWECGWDPNQALAAGHEATDPFYGDVGLALDLHRVTARRFDGLEGEETSGLEARSVASRRLAGLRAAPRGVVRQEAEWATFVDRVLEFFSSTISEALAAREQTAEWVRTWSSRTGLSVWRRHCIGNVSIALSHALLRYRRTSRERHDARELLDAADRVANERRHRQTGSLRLAAHLVMGGGVEKCVAVETCEVAAVFARLHGLGGGRRNGNVESGDLIEAWTHLARPSKGRASQSELLPPWLYRSGLARVTYAAGSVASYGLDEAIDTATAVSMGSDDDVMPIERAFAREIIGTAQALRGDVDAAIEAFSIARETYVALEDAFRIRNVDEQIAELRASG